MVAGFPKIVRIVNEEGFAFLDASFLLRCESGCKLWGFSKKLFGSFSGFSSRPGNESAVKWVEIGWNAKSGILVVGGFKLRIMGEDLKFSNHGRSEDLNFKSGQSGQHKNCRHKEKEDLLISFNCTLGKCSKKKCISSAIFGRYLQILTYKPLDMALYYQILTFIFYGEAPST